MMSSQIRKSTLSEFFQKNLHLLGFSYPAKNLVIVVHELITNSIDNCVENHISPEILITLKQEKDFFVVTVKDNGTGIPKENLHDIFSHFLQSSKFNVNVQTLGSQGIGLSGCVLFSKIYAGKQTEMTTVNKGYEYKVIIDLDIQTETSLNKIISEKKVDENKHGTEIKIYLKNVIYSKGKSGVDEYLKMIYLSNPFAHIIFNNEIENTKTEYKQLIDVPKSPEIAKFHIYGLNANDLIRLFNASKSNNLYDFLKNDLQKMSAKIVDEIQKKANLVLRKIKKGDLDFKTAEKIINTSREVKIRNVSSTNLLPIGEKELEKSLKELYNPEFSVIIERPAKVINSGIPFQVEVAVGYAGECGRKNSDGIVEPANIRFSNRVPLLFDYSSDVVYKVMNEIKINSYIRTQSLSIPLTIITNINSTNIFYNNTSKQSVSDIDEYHKELHLAITEALRKISIYVNKREREKIEAKYKDKIISYTDIISDDLEYLSDNYKSKSEIKNKLLQIVGKR